MSRTFKIFIENGFVNCDIEEEFVIEDDEIEGKTAEEFDKYIAEVADELFHDLVIYSYSEVIK